jgi:putative nucleotidyltransferase with HDIG domain
MHQTKVLLDSAFSQRLAGQWQSAIELYERVFASSVEAGDAHHLIEAVLALGHSYRELGDAEQARELYELTVELAKLSFDPGQSSRALNGLAILHQSLGSMELAISTYQEARKLALLTGDGLLIGSVDQNLGTLANIRGQLTESTVHYQSALERFRAINHDRGVAGVLNNLGMLYVDLNHLDEADDCLSEALSISKVMQDVVTESIVHTNRTELLIARGDATSARASCDEAFEISSKLGDHRIRADALKFYGIIYRETGKPHLAEIHLRQAIAVASKYQNTLTEAEARRELALVLRAQERNREALESLNLALATFSELQAQQEQADVNRKVSQLQDDFLSLVRFWGESIEEKDLYTRGHCQRVADYACRIAEKIGFSESELVWFRMGAFLHDVGKTEVPVSILNKPGKLTDEERKAIELHPVTGDEMLSTIEFPWDIRPMVRWHHERWDGEGYPDQLAGEAIPLTARVLRIADIFDALTTSRSYRLPLSAEDALQIMVDDQGSFDPELFEVFEGLFEEFSGMVGGFASEAQEVSTPGITTELQEKAESPRAVS